MQECDANVDGGWKLEQVQVPAQLFHAIRQPVDVERLRTFTEKSNLGLISLQMVYDDLIHPYITILIHVLFWTF